MAEDDTYTTLVYHVRNNDDSCLGAGDEVIKSGGIIRGHSGGIMSMESGFIWTLASQNILTKDMVRVLHSWHAPVTIIPSALAVSLSVQNENLPDNVRYVTIVGSATVVTGSIWLTSCSAGREVFLRLVGDISGGFTNNATSIVVSCSGCILLGSVGAAISGFEMHTSAASDCGVHLIAVADNTWAIVSQYGDIDE